MNKTMLVSECKDYLKKSKPKEDSKTLEKF